MRVKVLVPVLCISVVLGWFFLLPGSTSAQGESPKLSFDSSGRLLRPASDLYRSWVYIGTPLTPNDLNPPEAAFPDFHNVYIHPGDYSYYKTNGVFRDGTVLVKELVSVGSKAAVSGNGYFMGEFTGLEATIKDSQRFPNELGYWAYFSFGHSYPLADTAEPFPAAACNSCHEASAAEDFAFTQYYPVLRAAKASRSPSGVGLMGPGEDSYEEMAGAMSSALGDALNPTAETGDISGGIPTGQGELFQYLTSGRYKDFPARESESHPTMGPHTKLGWPVQVFVNATLDASMKAGSDSHPVGSGAVKEMYDADGDLQGWAVMFKTQADSEGGKGWFWYEVTSTTDGSSPVGIGNGIPLCFGCHATGRDYVITRYPLR